MMEMENYETEQATQIMQCKTVEIFLMCVLRLKLVWIDEVSTNDRNGNRTYGYSHKSKRATGTQVFCRGQRYICATEGATGYSNALFFFRFSTVGVMAVTGVLDTFSVAGSLTGEHLVAFADVCLIPCMARFPAPKSVVVLDNCSVHKNPGPAA